MIESVSVVRTIGLGISVETQNEIHAPSRAAAFEYHLKDGTWNLQSVFDLNGLTGPDAGTKTPDWVRKVIETKVPHSITADNTETVITIRPNDRQSRMLAQHTSGFLTHPGGVRAVRVFSPFDPTHIQATVVVMDEHGKDLKEFRIRNSQFDDLMHKFQVTLPGLPSRRPAFAAL